MHWRRFRIADIPTHSEDAFSTWLIARWREKDDLLQYYLENNRFPADEGVTELNGNANGGVNGSPKVVRGAGWIETEVKPVRVWEVATVFVPTAALGLMGNVLWKMGRLVVTVARGGR